MTRPESRPATGAHDDHLSRGRSPGGYHWGALLHRVGNLMSALKLRDQLVGGLDAIAGFALEVVVKLCGGTVGVHELRHGVRRRASAAGCASARRWLPREQRCCWPRSRPCDNNLASGVGICS